jgi:hypothetical protein
VWHVWVHALNADFDVPLITTRQLLPSTQVLGKPVYSVQNMYDVIDEDTENERHTKRGNQQIMEYYTHNPADIWSYMEKNFDVIVETQLLRKSIYNTFGLSHSVRTSMPRRQALRNNLKHISWQKWLVSETDGNAETEEGSERSTVVAPGTDGSSTPTRPVKSSAQKRREQRKRAVLRKKLKVETEHEVLANREI